MSSTSADQSSFLDPLPLTKFSFSTASDDDKALCIGGHDDLFTLRSFLGINDDEISLLDSFNAEESFFDLPEDVIADLETIPEIDECSPFPDDSVILPAPMSNLTHSVERLNISHDSSTTFDTAIDTFSDSTSTFAASQTFSSCSSSSSQGDFQISDTFAECMRKSSHSRQQLNLWQEQVRQTSSVSTSSANTSASSERKRSHSTIVDSTTSVSSTACTVPAVTSPNISSSPSLEATPPFPKRQARPETVICTAQFLCGSRPTLTAALEQSRQALKEYMLRAKCA